MLISTGEICATPPKFVVTIILLPYCNIRCAGWVITPSGIQVVQWEHDFDFDPLDATKIILEELVPVKNIETLTVNRNVDENKSSSARLTPSRLSTTRTTRSSKTGTSRIMIRSSLGLADLTLSAFRLIDPFGALCLITRGTDCIGRRSRKARLVIGLIGSKRQNLSNRRTAGRYIRLLRCRE